MSTIEVSFVYKQGKGLPFPCEGAYLVEVLVGMTAVRSLPLRDASTVLEWGAVVKGKGIPCYAGTGAFSLRR